MFIQNFDCSVFLLPYCDCGAEGEKEKNVYQAEDSADVFFQCLIQSKTKLLTTWTEAILGIDKNRVILFEKLVASYIFHSVRNNSKAKNKTKQNKKEFHKLV